MTRAALSQARAPLGQARGALSQARNPVGFPRHLTVNPLTEGPTWVHAGWAEDPQWQNPGDGALVNRWRDAGGVDPVSITPNSFLSPIFRRSVAALNNRSAVEFTRGNNTRLDSDIADIAQPLWVVLICTITPAAVVQRIMGGFNVATGGVGLSATDQFNIRFTTNRAGGVATGAAHLWVAKASGVNSSLFIDGAINIAVGDAGAVSMQHLTLGWGATNGLVGANPATGNLHFWGVATADPTLSTGWPAVLTVARACGIAV